jgi:rhodanese-related sulfurtransferase
MTLPIDVDAPQVAQWLRESRDFVLIDCREASEHATARIEGSVLLPMSQWAERQPDLAAFHGKHVVVHCHHGGRSLRVTQWLRENGFPDAQNLSGGIDAWSQEIDQSVPRY